MAKEEPPSTSKDLQELQRKLSLLIASVQSNSKAPDLEEVKKKLDFLGTTAAHKALPSLGFSKQEYWSGLPFPSPMRESENESEVTPSCPTPSDPMDCSLPGSSAHAILQVVSFMKSPVGQYLDRHPFLTLTLLVFVAVSAVPVGFFLLLVVLTSLAAFVGVILLEGLVISVGGLSLLCVLCGLGFVSLVISGAIMVSYMIVSSLINYWFSLRLLLQHNSSGDCPLAMKSAHVEGLYQE